VPHVPWKIGRKHFFSVFSSLTSAGSCRVMYHDAQFLKQLRSGVEVMRGAAAAEKTPREAKFIYTSIAVILAG
jgi:hypothetical protein